MPSKRCEAEGCTKWASFNQPGLKRPLYCRPHSQEGMVNVVSRQRCTSDNCPKQANFNHPGVFHFLGSTTLTQECLLPFATILSKGSSGRRVSS